MRRLQLLSFLIAITIRSLVASPTVVSAAIEARLVHAIQASHLKAGDIVFAKVTVPWEGTTCSLRDGSIIRGTVLAASVRSKTSKDSTVAVLFDSAECGGSEMKPLPLMLAALIAPDPVRDPNAYETMPLSAAVGAIGHGALDRIGPGQHAVTPMQAAIARINEPMKHNVPSTVKPGDVIGLNGVKLSISGGPQESSIVSSSRHNLNIEADTRLVLLVNPRLAIKAASSTSQPSASPLRPSSPEPEIDEAEICSPPACSIALAPSDAVTFSRSTAAVPTRILGYPSPPTREMLHFDHEAAITYLGSDQLLFTFNPHILVPRPGIEDASTRTTRLIRADLIDLRTMKVKRVIEWRVADENQYLWPLAGKRVLIHSGSHLSVYGPGLKLERSIPLEGPLAFVRTSPAGNYLAVGTTQERHSESTHQQLLAAERREPEEDVNVQVLDSSLKGLVNVKQSSRAELPVLLENGEVLTTNAGGAHWRIIEDRWSGEHRSLARITSTCRPQVNSLPPGLLFVVGCDAEQYGRWYRVLTEDGKLVLKGRSRSDELEHSASGSAGVAFAVSISRTTHARMASDVFHAADIKSQIIAVYDSTNGKRLMSANLPSPVPTRQTFALSPDGTQLVVVQADQIAFFRVSEESASRH